MTMFSPMTLITHRTLIVVFVLIGAFCAREAAAQSSFRLKRTKKETVPINVQLLAGYNGLSTPADIIQDYYEGTNLTSLGGVAVALQGMVELDTLLTQVWLGAEISYYRMAQRWLADDQEVNYVGETWAENPVDAVERLWGMGSNLLLAVGPFARFTLMGGPGLQYQQPRIDKELPIEGNLYEAQLIPTALANINFKLLIYDHGSIDANFRGLWSFGEYGSFQFQSMLGFTFNF